jgi:hypothetical protein
MHQLFGAYLNQDYAFWGDSIERVVDCYRRDSTPHQVASLVEELRRFRASHPDNLDAAFQSAHGFDVDPALWASTTSSFFDDLVRQLSAPAAPDGASH